MTFTIKILLAMKMTALILFIAIMQVSAGSYAQKITLSQKNAKLQHVFKEIWKQSGYDFVYDKVLLQKAKPVSFSVKDATIEEALTACFDGQPFTYSIDNKIIVVKQKEASLIQKIMNIFSVIDVKGKVVDENGLSLPGATVKVKGTGIATVTNEDGEFFLKGVSEDAVIVIAYLGYKPLELNAIATIGIVKLELETSKLDEVKISGGYYETTDNLKTGSIVKVTAKDIEKQPVTNPLMALQGRVAGLEITPMVGAPGVAPTIRIRGTNSLRNSLDENDGNYPLYVIDGVPVNSAPINSFVSANSYTKAGYDPLSTINTANIESIEVLKDGDATAIYGSRGANGVILITTKDARSNGKTSIDITTYSGVGAVSKKIDLLNSEQYLAMRREALANDGAIADQYDYDLKYWDTTRNTNWQKLLIGEMASVTDIQTSVSAGTRLTSFRFGGGYHKESLVFPGDFGYHRGSASLSLNHTSDDNKFKVSISINYGLDNSNIFTDNGGLVDAAVMLAPNAPKPYKEDGSLNWEQIEIAGTLTSTWDNPMASLLKKQKMATKNLMTNATIGYEIFPRLLLSADVGYTNLNGNETTSSPKIAEMPDVNALSGSVSFNDNTRTSWIIEPKLHYSKLTGKHEVSVIAGTTWQAGTASYSIVNGSQYTSDALLSSLKGAGLITSWRDDFTDYKYMSLYSRIGYNFNGKYLLNVTGRRDGSSRFGSGNRFGNFGAVGAAWIFSEERYIKERLAFLNFGKLRTSFGVTGSDQIGDYGYYSLYNSTSESYQNIKGLQPLQLFNPNYQWELTKKLEGALELGMVNNRFGLEVNWYRNRSSNQLVNFPLSVITGFPSVMTNFDATIENSGWEFSLRGELVSSGSWSWSVSANISLPNNKLIAFDGIENSPYKNIYKVGEPLSVKFLYHYTGINQNNGLYDFDDKNNDGLINDLDKSLFNLQPHMRYFGGLNNTIQYKGFHLSFLLQFSRQTKTRFLGSLPGRRGINQPTYVLQRWERPGDETDVQRFTTFKAVENSFKHFLDYAQSDHNVTNASFVRLKTLSLDYRLAERLFQKVRLSNVKIFVQGQNLFTITPYDGLDPETGNTLPPLRMATLGIQIKL